MDRSKIKWFWEVFSFLSQEIIKDPENETSIQKINKLVSELGDYDWEYGPSDYNEYYFCLSPNFQSNLLNEVNNIISNAPTIKGWKFLSGKPKKNEFISRFSILNEDNVEIVVDTNTWECVIYKFSDGSYDVDIKLDGMEGSEEMKYFAIDIHLTNLLGEVKYLKLIKDISIVSEFDNEAIGRSVLVKYIDKYIL